MHPCTIRRIIDAQNAKRKRASQVQEMSSSSSSSSYTGPKYRLWPLPSLKKLGAEIFTPSYKLVEYKDAPAVLQYNQYVETGYRAHLTTSQAIASMVHVHNESGNVWSHGGAFWMFVFLYVTGWATFGFSDLEEGGLWTLQAASALVCFFFSVCYHTFQSHGECSLSSYKAWLGYDLYGIVFAYVGSSVRRVWYGLHCYPTLRNACLAFTLTASAAVVVTAATGLLLRSPKTRVAIFGCLMFAANLSTICALYLRAGTDTARMLHIVAIGLQIAGGIINASRFPEKWLSSSVRRSVTDYVNSHTIMHVVTATSVWCTWEGCNVDWEWATRSVAPCGV